MAIIRVLSQLLLASVCLGQVAVSELGLVTSTTGFSGTNNPVTLTLYFDGQIWECSVDPPSTNTAYDCAPEVVGEICDELDIDTSVPFMKITNIATDALIYKQLSFTLDSNDVYTTDGYCVQQSAFNNTEPSSLGPSNDRFLSGDDVCADGSSHFDRLCSDTDYDECRQPEHLVYFDSVPNTVIENAVWDIGSDSDLDQRSCSPTATPSTTPSQTPSATPSGMPTDITNMPSQTPSAAPSVQPSLMPTSPPACICVCTTDSPTRGATTEAPSQSPLTEGSTMGPTGMPSGTPSSMPTAKPTAKPTDSIESPDSEDSADSGDSARAVAMQVLTDSTGRKTYHITVDPSVWVVIIPIAAVVVMLPIIYVVVMCCRFRPKRQIFTQ